MVMNDHDTILAVRNEHTKLFVYNKPQITSDELSKCKEMLHIDDSYSQLQTDSFGLDFWNPLLDKTTSFSTDTIKQMDFNNPNWRNSK
jgi:hypothetical protein